MIWRSVFGDPQYPTDLTITFDFGVWDLDGQMTLYAKVPDGDLRTKSFPNRTALTEWLGPFGDPGSTRRTWRRYVRKIVRALENAQEDPDAS